MTSICSVLDCERPSEARGWCTNHYRRWRKYDDPLGKPTPKPRRECIVEGCSLDFYSLGYCSSHYRKFRKYGDPLGHHVRPPRPLCAIQDCEKVALPRGFCVNHDARLKRWGNPVAGQHRAKYGSDDVGYAAAHCRVYKAFGKASEHTCVQCGDRAKDWSLRDIANPKIDQGNTPAFRGLRYSTHIEDYVPKCRSCNTKGDSAYRRGSATVLADTVRSVATIERPTLAA